MIFLQSLLLALSDHPIQVNYDKRQKQRKIASLNTDPLVKLSVLHWIEKPNKKDVNPIQKILLVGKL